MHIDGAGRRLPPIPALDGIRAIAVIAVLLYHADIVWMPGGFLGVEVFFVLSGYLITALLRTELRSTGRIDLKRFWLRRARRLLPALFVMLGVVTAAFVFGWPGEIGRVRGDIAAAFGYVSNWYLIGGDHSYFSSFGRPSPFRHLWSLAIEEQFYLLWPPVLLALFARLRRSGRVAGIAIGVALVSAIVMWLTYNGADPSRAYYGTDSRVAGLLLGAALALVWRPFSVKPWDLKTPPRVLDGIAIAASAFLVWSFIRFDEFAAFTYRPGIQLVGLATAVLIGATVHPGSRFGARLGWQPLRAIGRRSYAIYLWHWPVFVVTRPTVDFPLGTGAAFVVRVAVTLALAELSYRYVEEPLRRGAWGRTVQTIREHVRRSPRIARRAAFGWGTILTSVFAATGMLSVAVFQAPAPVPVALELPGLAEAVAPDSVTGLPSWRATIEPTVRRSRAAARARRSRQARPSASAAAAPKVAVFQGRLIAVGDSVMLGARTMLREKMRRAHVDAALSRQVADGLDVLRAMQAEDLLGDAVVVHLGNNGSFTSSQFDEMMQILSEVDRIVVVSVKVPRRWEGSVNRTLVEGAERYPSVAFVDWHSEWHSCPGEVFASDGVHLAAPGASCYADLIAAAL